MAAEEARFADVVDRFALSDGVLCDDDADDV